MVIQRYDFADRVAPFTGAWIEMRTMCSAPVWILVAPFTGAWIEIGLAVLPSWRVSRRSLHGSVD